MLENGRNTATAAPILMDLFFGIHHTQTIGASNSDEGHRAQRGFFPKLKRDNSLMLATLRRLRQRVIARCSDTCHQLLTHGMKEDVQQTFGSSSSHLPPPSYPRAERERDPPCVHLVTRPATFDHSQIEEELVHAKTPSTSQ